MILNKVQNSEPNVQICQAHSPQSGSDVVSSHHMREKISIPPDNLLNNVSLGSPFVMNMPQKCACKLCDHTGICFSVEEVNCCLEIDKQDKLFFSEHSRPKYLFKSLASYEKLGSLACSPLPRLPPPSLRPSSPVWPNSPQILFWLPSVLPRA